jgi:hypothetical protein
MSDITSVVLTDSDAIDHTFLPVSKGPSQCVWRAYGPSIPLLEEQVVVADLRRARSGKESSKAVVSLARPLVEQVDGVATVVGVDRVKCEFIISGAGDPVRRDRLKAMAQDMLSDAMVDELVTELVLPL